MYVKTLISRGGVFCVFLALVLSAIVPEDEAIVIPEKVMDLPKGNGSSQFPYEPTGDIGDYTMPMAPRISSTGILSIFNPARYGDNQYSKEFQFVKILQYNGLFNGYYLKPFWIEETEDTYIFYDASGILQFNKKTHVNTWYGFNLNDFDLAKHGHVKNGIAFYWSEQLELFCTITPANNEGKSIVHNEHEMRKSLSVKLAQNGIRLDENGILLVDGIPFLNDARAVVKYFSSIN